MIKTALFSFLLSLCLISKSQTVENDSLLFVKQSNEVVYFALNGKTDELLETIYPKLFEYASKETLKNAIEMVYKGNDEFKIKFDTIFPTLKFSEVYAKKDSIQNKYAFVSYPMKMTMIFNEAFPKEGQSFLRTSLESKGMKVEFVSDSEAKIFKENAVMVGFKDSYTNGLWKFINNDADNPFYEKIISTEVYDNLIKFKFSLEKNE